MKNTPFTVEETTIAKVHEAFRDGSLTCKQLTELFLARISRYDKALNSIILVNPNALAEAEALDKAYIEQGLTGSLHGIPILLKDNCETYDMATTAGSLSLKDWHTGRDSFITAKLRKAGALIIAKTNLHEFAVWGETISSILGQGYNPYDLTRTPGGSSGGTGAGLAANFGVVGIGTDTINSIRSPSSANSLVGIRPTIGLVSRSGIVPYSMTQDTAGPLARTVRDAVQVLDVIAGYDPEDAVTTACKGKVPETYTAYLKQDGLKGKRIGILHSFFGNEEKHAEVNSAVLGCIEDMKQDGAIFIDLDADISSPKLVSEVSVHIHDLKADLGAYLTAFGDNVPVHSIDEILASGKYHKGIEDNLRMANGLDIHSEDYKNRMKKKQECQQFVLELIEQHQLDAIVYPHQKQLVCKAGKSQEERNGALGAVTGYPSIVVPAGFSAPDENAPIGVPIGMELLGKPFSEGTLIEIGYGFEYRHSYRKAPIMEF